MLTSDELARALADVDQLPAHYERKGVYIEADIVKHLLLRYSEGGRKHKPITHQQVKDMMCQESAL